jgi:hypothetical protein
MQKTNYARTEDIDFFKDTRLSVIDEISFVAYQSTLTKISENLKSFTECREHIYGFLGDFCQLEAIGTTNQKCQIVTFFCYLDPNGPDYLSPMLFDTSWISYLTPHAIWHQCLLFGPKSSYLAPSVIKTSLFLTSLLLFYTPIVSFSTYTRT